MYDLDCKTQAPIETIFWLDEGAYVEYYSSSQNKWMPARVMKACAQPGTFDLDIRQAAEVQKMRPRGSNSTEKQTPSTLAAMPGMMCYSDNSSGQQPGEIKYETHKSDIRVRPRSKTPDSRRPSKDELRVEEEVRNLLANALRQGSPEALQAAISRANALGVNSGPDLAHAISVLHSMGARLKRTPSADALHPSNDPAPNARGQAMQYMNQGMSTGQGLYGPDGQKVEVQDTESEEQPAKKPGILTHVLGPKPTENAGLLTRVLGPKPNEEAGLLERMFGADNVFQKWRKGDTEEEDAENHDMYQTAPHNDAPFMTGAADRFDAPTDPRLKSYNMDKLQAASIESPYRTIAEQGRSSAPPTDPQLQHTANSMAGLAPPAAGRPMSQQLSTDPS
jgi:hypothetical protein